ncbi:hypothetical protein [Pontibacter sp. 13R65]|uniref:hypothetical protein n=1 Tax=Pontibacter sp. 13R65 TaxID=3127458 RepID=UPI00301DAF29
MNKFLKGDTVDLELTRQGNTWNHRMTVVSYNAAGEVICFWNDQQGSIQFFTFPESSLVKFDPKWPTGPAPDLQDLIVT